MKATAKTPKTLKIDLARLKMASLDQNIFMKFGPIFVRILLKFRDIFLVEKTIPPWIRLATTADITPTIISGITLEDESQEHVDEKRDDAVLSKLYRQEVFHIVSHKMDQGIVYKSPDKSDRPETRQENDDGRELLGPGNIAFFAGLSLLVFCRFFSSPLVFGREKLEVEAEWRHGCTARELRKFSELKKVKNIDLDKIFHINTLRRLSRF